MYIYIYRDVGIYAYIYIYMYNVIYIHNHYHKVAFKGFMIVSEVSELYRELRETWGKRFLQVWSESDVMAPSYGPVADCQKGRQTDRQSKKGI